MKLQKCLERSTPDVVTFYIFWCPGCNTHHYVTDSWTIIGALTDSPTVRPSIRVRGPKPLCHMFITDGNIQYLSDCGHELKGKTIEMENV